MRRRQLHSGLQRALVGLWIAIGTAGALPGPARGQSAPAVPEDPAAFPRERILESEQTARAWMTAAAAAAQERAAQRQRTQAAQSKGTAEALLARGEPLSVPVLAASGAARAVITYTRPSPRAGLQATAEILGSGGQAGRSFAVVPFRDFLVSEDGSSLVAVGNDLGFVLTDGDLSLRLVFYDGSGREVGRDEGTDLSPIRSLVLLDRNRILVVGIPGRVLAYRLADGTRTWTVATQPDWVSNVTLLPGEQRIAVVSARASAARLLLLDPSGQTIAVRPYAGRIEGSGRISASADGSLLALEDVVGAGAQGGGSVVHRILDAQSGEVLRELR
jgi:hypothetical protein